jgi:hypothetical protein
MPNIVLDKDARKTAAHLSPRTLHVLIYVSNLKYLAVAACNDYTHELKQM